MSDLNGVSHELSVLGCYLTAGAVALGPSDIERATGISKGTASRLLAALAEAGWLTAYDKGKYLLGPNAGLLWSRYLGMCVSELRRVRAVFGDRLAPVLELLSQMAAADPFDGAAEPESGGDADAPVPLVQIGQGVKTERIYGDDHGNLVTE